MVWYARVVPLLAYISHYATVDCLRTTQTCICACCILYMDAN
jgi:hypothetical protein